jgi:hypothetical protein
MFIVSKPKKWERIVTTNLKRVSCLKSMCASSGLWKVHRPMENRLAPAGRHVRAGDVPLLRSFGWFVLGDGCYKHAAPPELTDGHGNFSAEGWS